MSGSSAWPRLNTPAIKAPRPICTSGNGSENGRILTR